jgi:putative membrane protein
MDWTPLTDSFAGLPAFLIWVGLSIGLIATYGAVYMLTTAHDELALIRRDNVAAAIAFAGSMIGYTLPLAVAAQHSATLLVFLVWGVVAIGVQVAIYWFFRLLMLSDVSARIERGEIAAGILLGAASLAGGIVDAAAMSI